MTERQVNQYIYGAGGAVRRRGNGHKFGLSVSRPHRMINEAGIAAAVAAQQRCIY